MFKEKEGVGSTVVVRTYNDMEEIETKAVLFNLSLWNWIFKTLLFLSCVRKTPLTTLLSLSTFLGGLVAALSSTSDVQT